MIRYSSLIGLLLLCCSLSSANFLPEYDDDNPLPSGQEHERIKRYLRFKSRKPDPDAEFERGIGFRGHLMNLLKGGTLGVEFQIPHVDRFGKSFRHWKELMGDLDKKGIGKKDSDEKDEGEINGEEKVSDIEKREDNEVNYSFINPRTKKDDEP